MSSFTPFLLSPGLITNFAYSMLFVQCTHGYDGFCETLIYIIQQPHQLILHTQCCLFNAHMGMMVFVKH